MQTHAQIVRDVAHQTHAIGIVGFDGVIGKSQGIARARPPHIRRAFERIGKRIQFKRHGDVTTTQTLRAQSVKRSRKTINRRQYTLVAQRNTQLRGKLRVDFRRFAVRDRIADDGEILSNFIHNAI